MFGTIFNGIRLFRRQDILRSFHVFRGEGSTFIPKLKANKSTNTIFRNTHIGLRKIGHGNFSTTKAYKSNQWKNVSISGIGSSNIELKQDSIVLTHGDQEIEILYIWLRDHCRCDVCYNNFTFQRNFDNYALSLEEIPSEIEVDCADMTIRWTDGHITKYDIKWLVENTYHTGHKDPIQKVAWNKSIIQSLGLPTVHYQEYMESKEGLRKHVQNLIKFGFSIVTEAPPTHEGTLEVSKRLSFLQLTHFGDSWKLSATHERGDVSYTNIALPAHTDSSYFTTPPGLQVFHLLNHEGTGGETLLVDGQHCANTFKLKHPESYELLTKCVIPHEYFEPGIKIRSFGTVLSVHPTTGDFAHLRFHPGNRSPLFTLPVDKQRAFYRAYRHLRSEIRCPDNEFWIKLIPSMVLFTDNWRVLHGRSSFTGKRVLSGLYIPRDDFMSVAREFAILNL